MSRDRRSRRRLFVVVLITAAVAFDGVFIAVKHDGISIGALIAPIVVTAIFLLLGLRLWWEEKRSN